MLPTCALLGIGNFRQIVLMVVAGDGDSDGGDGDGADGADGGDGGDGGDGNRDDSDGGDGAGDGGDDNCDDSDGGDGAGDGGDGAGDGGDGADGGDGGDGSGDGDGGDGNRDDSDGGGDDDGGGSRPSLRLHSILGSIYVCYLYHLNQSFSNWCFDIFGWQILCYCGVGCSAVPCKVFSSILTSPHYPSGPRVPPGGTKSP